LEYGFFSQPGQDVFGAGDCILILPVRQVMTWASIAKAKLLHGAVQRVDTDLSLALAQADGLQVTDTPHRRRHTHVSWWSFEGLRHKLPVGISGDVE
jgi:hypothetical protein